MANGRRTFVLSRGLEYFSESELQMQIGRPRCEWPVTILKELIDNALDAAESVDAVPSTESVKAARKRRRASPETLSSSAPAM